METEAAADERGLTRSSLYMLVGALAGALAVLLAVALTLSLRVQALRRALRAAGVVLPLKPRGRAEECAGAREREEERALLCAHDEEAESR